MSEILANKITPVTGTTVTLGDSGDTFTIPSGVNITNSGTATGFGGGKVVQVVNVMNSTGATGTTVLPADNTIPQISEGNEVMTLAVTPTSSSNKLLISVVVNSSHSTTSTNLGAALFQDSTSNALAYGWSWSATGTTGTPIIFNYYMTAGTTSATTFKVRGGTSGGGTYSFNASAGVRVAGGVMASSITITEISA